jgi:hypothetical protein
MQRATYRLHIVCPSSIPDQRPRHASATRYTQTTRQNPTAMLTSSQSSHTLPLIQLPQTTLNKHTHHVLDTKHITTSLVNTIAPQHATYSPIPKKIQIPTNMHITTLLNHTITTVQNTTPCSHITLPFHMFVSTRNIPPNVRCQYTKHADHKAMPHHATPRHAMPRSRHAMHATTKQSPAALLSLLFRFLTIFTHLDTHPTSLQPLAHNTPAMPNTSQSKPTIVKTHHSLLTHTKNKYQSNRSAQSQACTTTH